MPFSDASIRRKPNAGDLMQQSIYRPKVWPGGLAVETNPPVNGRLAMSAMGNRVKSGIEPKGAHCRFKRKDGA